MLLSLVSHGQAALANHFLRDLERTHEVAELVVTENLPDSGLVMPTHLPVRHLQNPSPMGFAGNHNQAFEGCESPFFCVANPDIRLLSNPFPGLLAAMQDPRVGLVAPLVLSPAGHPEDNARRFPTPWNLGRKLLGGDDGRYHLQPGKALSPQPVEWVAGMFLLFRSEAFRDVGGFDAKFHLYYEDVDICARLWKSGWKVVCDPGVTVVHEAQRASRHNPRYMSWHAASMARYFFKHLGRLPSARSTTTGQ
ncbi:glycosyltransferase family 2 protein [Hydrogenophaga sp. SL48]|uniref:glycosyltransferase family 2 protein n=1 Tax=Hydrogenophaga sp. SL48 TaxID=2806347 RepID=UPI001F3807A0|nr:glycosyltransferase family 2 protein [Hydrogenophaga sp. SL48]UJW81818.1 glycosyltransferase [Hydrogenophaga sp. SL48]